MVRLVIECFQLEEAVHACEQRKNECTWLVDSLVSYRLCNIATLMSSVRSPHTVKNINPLDMLSDCFFLFITLMVLAFVVFLLVKRKEKKNYASSKKLLTSIKEKGPLGKESPLTRKEKGGGQWGSGRLRADKLADLS